MTILSALGLLAGGFLLIPKGMMIMLVIWLPKFDSKSTK
jgi:hypothetical protein